MNDLNAQIRAAIGKLLASADIGTPEDAAHRAAAVGDYVEALTRLGDGPRSPDRVIHTAHGAQGSIKIAVQRKSVGAEMTVVGAENLRPVHLDEDGCRALGRALLDFAGPEPGG